MYLNAKSFPKSNTFYVNVNTYKSRIRSQKPYKCVIKPRKLLPIWAARSYVSFFLHVILRNILVTRSSAMHYLRFTYATKTQWNYFSKRVHEINLFQRRAFVRYRKKLSGSAIPFRPRRVFLLYINSSTSTDVVHVNSVVDVIRLLSANDHFFSIRIPLWTIIVLVIYIYILWTFQADDRSRPSRNVLLQ